MPQVQVLESLYNPYMRAVFWVICADKDALPLAHEALKQAEHKERGVLGRMVENALYVMPFPYPEADSIYR